jgi:hypothetical protein
MDDTVPDQAYSAPARAPSAEGAPSDAPSGAAVRLDAREERGGTNGKLALVLRSWLSRVSNMPPILWDKQLVN